MTVIKTDVVPAELPEKQDDVAKAGDPCTMSQQDARDFHGHEIHPQQFVRLIGWHDSKARKHRLH